jgi:hypothetical protein
MDTKKVPTDTRAEQHPDDENISVSGSYSLESSMSDTTRHTDTRKSHDSVAGEVIADSLSRVVGRWRACVVIMLLITAAVVVTTTYLFMSNNEDAQFRKSVRQAGIRFLSGRQARQ